LQSVILVIIPRPSYDIHSQSLKNLEELGGKYQIAAMNAPEISSTTYRKTKDKAVIPLPVKEYIYQQKLYVS